jgi:hypothetical protein
MAEELPGLLVGTTEAYKRIVVEVNLLLADFISISQLTY